MMIQIASKLFFCVGKKLYTWTKATSIDFNNWSGNIEDYKHKTNQGVVFEKPYLERTYQQIFVRRVFQKNSAE